MPTIGIIRLELIGAALARRLIHGAVTPVKYELKSERVQEASNAGAIELASEHGIALPVARVLSHAGARIFPVTE